MTVGAYLKSLVIGLSLPDEVIERCARSPKGAIAYINGEPRALSALSVGDDVDDFYDDDTFDARLDYAASTVYYSVLGVFAGGGYSEKVGDVSLSQSGYTVTQADRERYKSLADKLREKWGLETESSPDDDSGMFDATYLRYQ